MLNKLFNLSALGTTVRKEVVAGLTTFLTMAYIIFVNPSILASAGMDYGAVFVATCIAAAIGCMLMGLLANYPIALAPGMGLNAFFAFTVVGELGYSWQVALGAVFWSGLIFLALSLFKIREWVINSIPLSMRYGIAAGIGMFLAIIALKNSAIIVGSPATLVTLGDITQPSVWLSFLSFVVIVALSYRKVPGSVMIGVLAVTALGIMIGISEFKGIASAPPSMAPTFMQLDIWGALDVAMISVIISFLFVDLFDTSGTLIGVAQKAGLVEKNGHMPRMGKALMADSSASVVGSVLGTSTTTSYIESTAGVSVGGKSGLTAVVVGLCFVGAIFFSPLASSVPGYATAGALLYISVLMMSGLINIDWNDISESAPVVITVLAMPLTFSIAHGIGLGFITYTAIKLLSGRYKDVSAGVWFITIAFLLKFIYL